MPPRQVPTLITWIALAGLLIVAGTRIARAEEYGDPAEGHRLAQQWCSNCHVIERSAQSGASNGAPSFAAIAGMKAMTPMALHVFLQTPHDRMPDLHLTRNEIDDLIAYITSLRH